jgi:7-dehydrocholesterol reductase
VSYAPETAIRQPAQRCPPRLPTSVFLQGEVKDTILLMDGWWSVSRHFHYVPEILAAFFW